MRVVILARKNLQYNTRVERQAQALVQAGHEVLIVTMRVGDQPTRERKNGYEIVRLELWPLHRRLPQALSALQRRLLERLRWVRCPSLARAPSRGQGQAQVQNMASTVDETSESRSYARLMLRFVKRLAKETLRLVLRLIREALRSGLRPFAQPLTTLDFTLKAYRLLKDSPADIFQAHDSSPLAAAYLLAKRHRAKLVYDAVEIVTERTGRRWGRIGTAVGRAIGRAWEGFFIRRAHGVITPTPVIAEVLRDRYRVDPQLVMNCTWYRPPEALQGSDLRARLPIKNAKVLLYVGAISAHNGVDYLIRSLHHLPKDVVLVLLGPMQPRYEPQCRALIKAERLADRVFILPPVPPDQVPAYAASADVGVVAYQRDTLNNYATLPNKFFEYLMARLPIAAPSFPALKGLIEGENIGRLYEPSNVQDIARVVQELLSPEVQARVRANLERAARKYSWEREAEKLLAFYECLAHGNQSHERPCPQGVGAAAQPLQQAKPPR